MHSSLRTLAIASAAAIIAGAFLPSVRVPIFGDASLYEYWQGGALAVVACAALAIGAAVMRVARPLPILGIGALFFIVRAGMRVKAGVGSSGGGERSAVRDFMTGLAAAAELTWGYWVLVVGAALLVVAGVLLQQRRDDEPHVTRT